MAAGLVPGSPFHLGGIRILLYHGLTASAEAPVACREERFWSSTTQFRDQLRQVAERGLSIAPLREAWAGEKAERPARRLVVVSFDDGWGSDFSVALPLLLKAGVQAEFFVNTGSIGTAGFLTWPQIVEMHRMGMSFQSHSRDHVHLLGLSSPLLRRQLRESKRTLEDRLGSAVDFLSAPFGLLSRRIVETALQEGYRAVCTAWPWPARSGKRVLHRIAVTRATTPVDFSRLLDGHAAWYLKQLSWSGLKYGPRRLLRYPPTPPPVEARSGAAVAPSANAE